MTHGCFKKNYVGCIFLQTRIQIMNFPSTWDRLKMETTSILMLGIILVAASMKGEATVALGKIADPGQIEEPQWQERAGN